MADNNLDFIMLGEIYLKRGPEIYNPDKDIDEISDKISDIEFDMSKENPDFSGSTKLENYQALKNFTESLRGKMDYTGTTHFWQVNAINDSQIELNMCESTSEISKTYTSIGKLKKDFIKLSEFLEKATFVGREFKRTSPILTFSGKLDKSYMQIIGITKYIVLYATQDLFLIKRINDYGNAKYALINSRHTLDGKYEFFGPVYEEYKDKNKVYSEILAQATKDNRKNKGK